MTEKIKKSPFQQQEQASRLVEMHILQCASQFMDNELADNPEILYGATNYKAEDEEGNPTEIYEWWIVSDWLGEKLKQRGEVVLEVYNFTLWGRQGTGQAIKLDNVIQELAKEYNF